MPEYQYRKIGILAESLEKAGIAQQIIDRIMEGGESIRPSTTSTRKADWMKEAMLRMNSLLDKQTRQAVREACACCLGGRRQQIVRGIARRHKTLQDRVRAANEAKLVFGHSVALQQDGTVLVCFSPQGLDQYRCVCLPKASEPLPITYCYCCGGHVKHHLQIALGCNLALTVRSSALSSGGRKPCTFVFSLEGSTPRPKKSLKRTC